MLMNLYPLMVIVWIRLSVGNILLYKKYIFILINKKVTTLMGHTSRVLFLAMSPDGETIVTGAGDETLRFWNVFPKKEET